MGEKDWTIYSTLDFDFVPPVRSQNAVARIIKMAYPNTFYTWKGVVTAWMLVMAWSKGDFNKPGHYLFIVHRRFFRFKYQLIFNT